MKIDLQLTGLEKVQKQLDRLSGPQAREAYAKAVNDTAFQVRRKMQAEMAAVFDRPTPYILRSIQFKPATPERSYTEVLPTYYGGKGVDPQKILDAQAGGGSRRDKRSEAALRRVGILPRGYQTVIPSVPFPGSYDRFGNLKGSFLVQLLSYLQALDSRIGDRSNMTEKNKKAIHKGKKQMAGRRYFVSFGKLRGNRSSHLAPGIWAAMGTGGVDVRPVLMFVKAGSYRVRLDLDAIAAKAGGADYLARRLRFRIRQAAGE